MDVNVDASLVREPETFRTLFFLARSKIDHELANAQTDHATHGAAQATIRSATESNSRT